MKSIDVPNASKKVRARARAAPHPMAMAFTIADAQAMGAPGRTKIYGLAKRGELKLLRVAGRTLVDGDSLRELLQVSAAPMRDLDWVDRRRDANLEEKIGREAPAVAERVEENMLLLKHKLAMMDQTAARTCGRCSSYDKEKGSWCSLRDMTIQPYDPMCPDFDPAEETPD